MTDERSLENDEEINNQRQKQYESLPDRGFTAIAQHRYQQDNGGNEIKDDFRGSPGYAIASVYPETIWAMDRK